MKRTVWWGALRTGLVGVLACGLIGAAQDAVSSHRWGGITHRHLGVALLTTSVPALPKIDFRNFTYRLYPTESLDPTRSGIPTRFQQAGIPPRPDASDTAAPRIVTVSQGIYDRRADADNPVEFDVLRVEMAKLPDAPEHQAALVFGILYTGAQASMCTGVVQMLERRQGKLILTDQFTYDCRGGASATYDAKKRRLSIQSARYAAGDRLCCPSLSDKVTFRLDGREVKAGDVQAPFK